jgi:hypothetical protein
MYSTWRKKPETKKKNIFSSDKYLWNIKNILARICKKQHYQTTFFTHNVNKIGLRQNFLKIVAKDVQLQYQKVLNCRDVRQIHRMIVLHMLLCWLVLFHYHTSEEFSRLTGCYHRNFLGWMVFIISHVESCTHQ